MKQQVMEMLVLVIVGGLCVPAYTGQGVPCYLDAGRPYKMYESLEEEVGDYLLLRHGAREEKIRHMDQVHGMAMAPILERFAKGGIYSIRGSTVSGGRLQAGALSQLWALTPDIAYQIAEGILLERRYVVDSTGGIVFIFAAKVIARAPQERAVKVLRLALERWRDTPNVLSDVLQEIAEVGGLPERDLLVKFVNEYPNVQARKWLTTYVESLEVRLGLRPAPPPPKIPENVFPVSK